MINSQAQRLLVEADFNRLMIRVPVRHGKSLYCNWALPIEYVLKHPNNRVIIATHTVAFSEEWTGAIRDFLKKWGKVLTGIQVHPDDASRKRFRILDHRGEVRAVGTGGSCAGAGANLIVADDLFADQEEANSPTQRKKMENWFASEVMTRLEPGGKVLMLGSARHPEELMQRNLDANVDLPPDRQWQLVKFPAINERGEALWPERFPVTRLRQIQAELEQQGYGHLFSALYQQDPRCDPSAIEWPEDYTRDLLYDNLPPDLAAGTGIRMRVIALDPSVGSNAKAGDYAAMVLVLLDETGVLWVDETLMALKPIDQVEDTAVEWLGRHNPDAALVEANGFQRLVCDNIQRKAKAAGLNPPMHAHVSTENKEVRIRLCLTSLLATHRIKIRRSAASQIGMGQLRSFPSAEHDDFVDALALAVALIAKLTRTSRTPQPTRHA